MSFWLRVEALRFWDTQHQTNTMKHMPGWWFGTFSYFPHIGNNDPNWLIFFRGVETTNQMQYSLVKWQNYGNTTIFNGCSIEMGRDGCFPATPGSGRASPKVLQTHLRDAGELLQDARRIRHRNISMKNHRGWGMVNHPKNVFFILVPVQNFIYFMERHEKAKGGV